MPPEWIAFYVVSVHIGTKFEDRKKNDMQYTYVGCKILKVRWGKKI